MYSSMCSSLAGVTQIWLSGIMTGPFKPVLNSKLPLPSLVGPKLLTVFASPQTALGKSDPTSASCNCKNIYIDTMFARKKWKAFQPVSADHLASGLRQLVKSNKSLLLTGFLGSQRPAINCVIEGIANKQSRNESFPRAVST